MDTTELRRGKVVRFFANFIRKSPPSTYRVSRGVCFHGRGGKAPSPEASRRLQRSRLRTTSAEIEARCDCCSSSKVARDAEVHGHSTCSKHRSRCIYFIPLPSCLCVDATMHWPGHLSRIRRIYACSHRFVSHFCNASTSSGRGLLLRAKASRNV